jgi:hypothetical protein
MDNDSVISKTFGDILVSYPLQQVGEPIGKDHATWIFFDKLKAAIQSRDILKKYPNIEVNWSAGLGRLARIRWVAFLDNRVTKTTTKGIYCVYLFCQDMAGLYFTYNQGVTDINDAVGRKEASSVLRTTAQRIRLQCEELEESGFKLDNNIDLHTTGQLGTAYENSTIAYKFYEKESLPTDSEILKDLDTLLEMYNRHVVFGVLADSEAIPARI